MVQKSITNMVFIFQNHCSLIDCHSEEIGKLLNFLAEGKQMSIFTESLAKSKQRVEDTIYDQTSGPMTSHFQIMKQNQFMVDSASQALSQPQTDIKIGEVMENVTKAVTNSQVKPVILNSYVYI